MSSTPAVIYGAKDETAVRLRVTGRADAHQSPAVREFCVNGIESGCREVRVDLRECPHFDSTFLGTLLHLQRICPAGRRAVVIVNPSGECVDILRRMGAAQLFTVITEPDEPDCHWQALAVETPGQCSAAFKLNVVDAHQELAGVDGPLQARYRLIAEMAAADLESAQRHR